VIGGTGADAHASGNGTFNGSCSAALGSQVNATFDLDLGGVQ